MMWGGKGYWMGKEMCLMWMLKKIPREEAKVSLGMIDIFKYISVEDFIKRP